MMILALESSATACGVALTRDGELLAQAYQHSGLTHSRTLLPMVDSVLNSCGESMDHVDVVAVAAGPGSFTGLRIGVSAAKGLAWTLDVPCCGVSTLLAMAQNLRHMEGCTVVCAMDARRNQVYNAVFRVENGQLLRRCEDRAIGLAELAEELKNDTAVKIVVGDGAKLCHTYLTQQGIPCRMAPAQLVMQNAAGVALAAEELAAEGKTVSAHELVPVYLRLSQAERERLAKGLKITVD